MAYQPLINASYCSFPAVEFPPLLLSFLPILLIPFFFLRHRVHKYKIHMYTCTDRPWHSSFLVKQQFTASANLPPLQDILNTTWVKLIECLPLPASLRAPGYSRINNNNNNGLGARTVGGGRIGGVGSTIGRRSSLDDENQLIDELDEDWDDEP